jgi:hypothetical protein
MRGKAQRGEYGSWDALRADMRCVRVVECVCGWWGHSGLLCASRVLPVWWMCAVR